MDEIDETNEMKNKKKLYKESKILAGIGIIIGIIAMFILSFVKIPALKLIPCFVVIAMVTIMFVDLGNVIEWIKVVLDKYYSDGGVVVNVSKVLSGIMAGAYILAAGLIAGIISCFVKVK